MKKGVLLLVVIVAAISSNAQNIAGDWNGLFNSGNMKEMIVFHISRDSDLIEVTLDNPDRKAYGLPAQAVSFVNNKLSLSVQSYGMTFSGLANNSFDTIRGILENEKEKSILVLTRTREAKCMTGRPQDPTDFPYLREEVSFRNSKANIVLSGTLTLPKDKKAGKIVILISGSGPQNRDEEVFNQRPFLVWSDWLTKQGIGVLRYDDRGVGKSTGQFSEATSLDFADDVESAIDYLRSREDLKNISIGLIGHSEGGMIAPIVASRNSNVDFIVMLAGPGIPIDQLLVRQVEDIMILESVPENIIHLTVGTFKKSLSYLKDNSFQNKEQVAEGLREILKAEYAKYPEGTEEKSKPEIKIEMEVKQLANNWFRYFVSYIPSEYLKSVSCPVLALNGTLDCQVNYKSNLAAIQEALENADNKSVVIEPMEGLNHILQRAETGAVSEYGKIDETINPAALLKVSSWIINLN